MTGEFFFYNNETYVNTEFVVPVFTLSHDPIGFTYWMTPCIYFLVYVQTFGHAFHYATKHLPRVKDSHYRLFYSLLKYVVLLAAIGFPCIWVGLVNTTLSNIIASICAHLSSNCNNQNFIESFLQRNWFYESNAIKMLALFNSIYSCLFVKFLLTYNEILLYPKLSVLNLWWKAVILIALFLVNNISTLYYRINTSLEPFPTTWLGVLNGTEPINSLGVGMWILGVLYIAILVLFYVMDVKMTHLEHGERIKIFKVHFVLMIYILVYTLITSVPWVSIYLQIWIAALIQTPFLILLGCSTPERAIHK